MQEFVKPIGLDSKMDEAVRALRAGKPTMFYGPSGTGKTIAAWQVANFIAQELGNEVIYLQLYPEVTKNVLIGGETIKNGNIVVDIGPIIKLGGASTQNGATFIIDECTHATEPALLGFNSLIEAPYQTVIGANVERMHPGTRYIFAGNTPDHAGNVPLPSSFANRLYVIDFPVPGIDNLTKILAETAGVKRRNSLTGLQEFVLTIAYKTRGPNFAISPRNIINCMEMLKAARGTGFKQTPAMKALSKRVVESLKKSDIHPDEARNIILATMLGNIVAKNDGPDKVKALLWEA